MPETTEMTSPPASTWVRFLRNYGPLPTNGNLFDEHVNKALKRANVQPITLPTPRLEEMFEALQTGRGSLLVAGTAGDGKTYHCRSLWERLGGAEAEWNSSGNIKSLQVAERRFVFVKDLSALTFGSSDSQHIFDGLQASVDGEETTSYVIATNHGKILEHLRDREQGGPISPLREAVQRAFLDADACHPRLKVVDLSKASNRGSLDDVLNAVAQHPEWSRCHNCALNADGQVCPIYENRTRILGQHDDRLFARRLGDLVELSRLNGTHLPVRDMLTLVTNVVLGHPDAKEGLMTCADVPKIQADGTVDQASLYRNTFFANLKPKRAAAQPVSRTLGLFGVGAETGNGVDGLLVYGSDDTRLNGDFNDLVANDPLFGASAAFITAQRAYLEGDERDQSDDNGNEFLKRLADQRRRLFFTLPESATALYSFWELTAFSHAGAYLSLLTSFDGVKNAVSDRAKTMVIKGLNRVFTGLLLENVDKLFVAEAGGSTRSRTSVLCQTEIAIRRGSGGSGLAFRRNDATGIPCIEVVLGADQAKVAFDLTPIRFEFLCHVAEGALPGSFSSECLEDVQAFKARLLRQSEAERRALAAEYGSSDDSELDLSFIEINDRNGNGSLERITVRVPA